MIFADIIVDVSVKSLDRPFQYLVPEEMVADAVIGASVIIPFGKGNREMKGYIIGLSGTAKYDIHKTKSVLRVEKQGVVAESHLLSLAYWIKENFGGTMNDAIKAVMPVRKEVKEKVARHIIPALSRKEMEQKKVYFEQKHNTARARILQGLLEQKDYEKGAPYETFLHRFKATAALLKGLEEKGILKIVSKQIYRDPLSDNRVVTKAKILNEEQRTIVEQFITDFDAGIRKDYLIHGVTGSGKTEVYMNLIDHVLQKGKQAIVLIPEIALTFQTVQRFYGRFGSKVSIMHSRLSAGERYDQFVRAKRGEIQIMIGPRSALFTPFSNLGLIVIDEEHESSYQSDSPPKYHAREVAVQRAKMLHASVVMGSATPSLEAYYRCQMGEYSLMTLTKRVGNAQMAEVEIADLRAELKARNFSIFSRRLQEEIKVRLQKREQIILFINRRGYAGFVSCRECGEVIQCDSCSVAMKPHEYKGKVSILKCHYCGAQKQMPKVCPSCGSKYIGTFGLGTQQVEEMIHKHFPEARVLRMDADTTSGKEGHSRILQQFAQQKADILVGTQMIVKGHDFENVTLVGILAADLSLNTGSYRAAERTFALLAQACGRAGRGKKAGKVILQTYQPDHYSIQCAAAQDYKAFYRQEIAKRQMLQYPPISNILEVLVFSEKEEKAAMLAEVLKSKTISYHDMIVLGPNDAPIAKLRDVYRKILYIRSKDYQMLCNVKDHFEKFMQTSHMYNDCRITFTFNNES